MKKLIPSPPAATLSPMKISFHACLTLLALVALAPFSATAETRMQVAAGSTPVYTQPSAGAQKVGIVSSGDILFVSRIDGDWVAVAPPDNFDLWLNKDFIEGNRVIAKSIQIRSGPGVQYDAVGTLERGAPVMPRGEDGDWCKIAPPSSAILWVQKGDLSEVRTHTSPIQEVTTVAEPPKPVPAPQPEPAPTPAVVAPAPQPAPQMVAQPAAAPATPVKIVPSNPNAPAPKPTTAPQVAAARATVPAAPTLRPATVIPSSGRRPAATAAAPSPAQSIRRPPAMPAVSKSVPAPASAVTAQKSKDVEVKVDQTLVDDLDLANLPDQGKALQIEGELRNAPFMAASPSRYRLVDEDEDGLLQMVCHIHGDPEELRQYVGKKVSIRGREYWVEDSDMPVIVVGQIVPLAPPE